MVLGFGGWGVQMEMEMKMGMEMICKFCRFHDSILESNYVEQSSHNPPVTYCYTIRKLYGSCDK